MYAIYYVIQTSILLYVILLMHIGQIEFALYFVTILCSLNIGILVENKKLLK